MTALRPRPVCPACGSTHFIKIGRYPDGNCRVRCLDCKHEASLTNAEYYVTLFAADGTPLDDDTRQRATETLFGGKDSTDDRHEP